MQNKATRVIAVFKIMTEYRVMATRLLVPSIMRRTNMQTDILTQPNPIGDANVCNDSELQKFAQGRQDVDNVPPHAVLYLENYQNFSVHGEELIVVSLDGAVWKSLGVIAYPCNVCHEIVPPMRVFLESYINTQCNKNCSECKGERNDTKSRRATIYIGGKVAWRCFSHHEKVEDEQKYDCYDASAV